jgi:WD40 repeat protein
VRQLVGHTRDVRAVAYLPDGRLVSGGSDRTVRVWNVVIGEAVHTIRAGTPVYAVAATPDLMPITSRSRPSASTPVRRVTPSASRTGPHGRGRRFKMGFPGPCGPSPTPPTGIRSPPPAR